MHIITIDNHKTKILEAVDWACNEFGPTLLIFQTYSLIIFGDSNLKNPNMLCYLHSDGKDKSSS
jgi:hypothetical protein